MNPKTLWSINDIEMLHRFVKKGFNSTEIHGLARFEQPRTLRAIRDKITKLRLRGKRIIHKWSESEKEDLRNMYKTSTMEELIDWFGRSYHSINRCAKRLKLRKRG